MKYECLECFFTCYSLIDIINHRRGYSIKGHVLSHHDKSFQYATKALRKTPPIRTDLLDLI